MEIKFSGVREKISGPDDKKGMVPKNLLDKASAWFIVNSIFAAEIHATAWMRGTRVIRGVFLIG
jgi:hypothetical protein